MAKELVLVAMVASVKSLKLAQRWLWDPSIRLHSYQKKDQKTLLLNLKQQSRSRRLYCICWSIGRNSLQHCEPLDPWRTCDWLIRGDESSDGHRVHQVAWLVMKGTTLNVQKKGIVKVNDPLVKPWWWWRWVGWYGSLGASSQAFHLSTLDCRKGTTGSMLDYAYKKKTCRSLGEEITTVRCTNNLTRLERNGSLVPRKKKGNKKLSEKIQVRATISLSSWQGLGPQSCGRYPFAGSTRWTPLEFSIHCDDGYRTLILKPIWKKRFRLF